MTNKATITKTVDDGACKVPLVEQLRRIPKEALLRWTDEDGLQASHSVPIGRLAHEAADALTRTEPAPSPSLDVELIERLRGFAEAMREHGHSAAGYGGYSFSPDDYDNLAARLEALSTPSDPEMVEKVALIVGDKLGGHAGMGETYRRSDDVRWAQSLDIATAALAVCNHAGGLRSRMEAVADECERYRLITGSRAAERIRTALQSIPGEGISGRD